MAKIIHFNTNVDKLDKYLDETKQQLIDRSIDNVMIIAKDKQTGEVVTGYCNLDFGEKAELISHAQVDLIDSMIQQNYVWN